MIKSLDNLAAWLNKQVDNLLKFLRREKQVPIVPAIAEIGPEPFLDRNKKEDKKYSDGGIISQPKKNNSSGSFPFGLPKSQWWIGVAGVVVGVLVVYFIYNKWKLKK